MCRRRALLFLVFLLVLSGCSNTSAPLEESTGMSEDIEIRFISGWGGYDVKSQLLEEKLAHISQQTDGLNIINESLDNETYMTKLKTDYVSGNAQDIFMMEPGEDLDNLIELHKIASLTALAKVDEQWYNSFDKDLWDYVTYNDMIYGIPLEVDYQSMFVNALLFEQYNVKIPETYSELQEAIRIFKRKGIIPIAFNISDSGMQLYENIVLRLGSAEEISEPLQDGEISQCYIEAMYYLKELNDLGAFPEDAFLLSDEKRDQLFLNNEAAMIINDASFIGEPMLSPDADWVQIVRFPYFDERPQYASTIIYGVGSGTLHMSSECYEDELRREKAWEIIKAITSEEFSLSLKINSCVVPAVNSTFPKEDWKALLYETNEYVLESGFKLLPLKTYFDTQEWRMGLIDQIPYVIEGARSPEEVEKIFSDYSTDFNIDDVEY